MDRNIIDTAALTAHNFAAALTAHNFAGLEITEGSEHIVVKDEGLTMHVHTCPIWIALNLMVVGSAAEPVAGPENDRTFAVYSAVRSIADKLLDLDKLLAL